jgi:collagen type I/II/III/V/XI/XXIV/XXVII alpha
MSEVKDSAEAIGAEVAAELYGVTGSGIKIGIISDSYDAHGGAAANVAAGDLPDNVVVESDSAMGADEGQAMTELAYQAAPGASYYFATCGDSLQTFAAAVTSLQNAGCNIIVDDVTFPTEESLYQTGTVLDQAIESAVAAGVNDFTATGNSGDDYVQQGFSPIAVTIPGISPFALTANDFGGGSPYQAISISEGADVTIDLQWAQPFATIGTGSGGAQNSLAFYLIDSAGRVVAGATEVELGKDPVQAIEFTNDTGSTQFRLVVVENGGTTPTGQTFTISVLDSVLATLQGSDVGAGSGDVMGHALVSGVNAVGAVSYSSTPAFGVSPAVPAYYTATGPGTILYNSEGQPLATPITVDAPTFLSVSGSSTTVAGFAPFNGTSAAAPNAAAVAALMLSANGTLTTAEVTGLLEQSAIPVSSTTDDAGAGLIQARAAVELSVAAAGTRWSAAAGGGWSTTADWSTGALPTASGAVMLGNDLGAISTSYGLTVDTSDATAGSLTLSAPAGQSVTLTLGAGAGLAVGGPAASDITAGDLLVGAGGTISLEGGDLSVTGSLNTNAGTVVMTGGDLTAGNYAQDAGGMSVSGGTVALTGTIGLAETGGTVTIGAGAVLDTTVASVSAATLSVAGAVDDAGILSRGAAGGAGSVSIGATGSLTIGAGASGVGIAFAGGGGLLDFTSDSSTVLTGELTSVISGFDDGSSIAEFGALTYEALDAYSYEDGALTIADGTTEIAELALDPSPDYSGFNLMAGPADQLEVTANTPEVTAVPCFAAGTRLLTERGAVAVETLEVGDHVLTADGGSTPITWTGLRRVDCHRHREPGTVLPVRIAAHAFGEGLPVRDLFLSPDHAIFAENVLVPIKHLVDGGAVRQVDVARITYVHIELAQHEILLAEGLPVESYLDAGDRATFSGGGVVALHPEWGKHEGDVAMLREALAYAPIRVTGREVDRVRCQLADRRRNQSLGGASKTRLTA